MNEGLFYSATDIAKPLVGKDIPQKEQFSFLEWLRDWEWLFLPPEWREGNDGLRKMLLAVQNAISFVVDQESFDAERDAVEQDGGTLPNSESATGPWQFLKTARLQIVLGEFLERRGATQKRMKCSTILDRCGVHRRSEAFCREFECAAAFYHIGIRPAGEKSSTFSIAGFPLAANLFLVRL